MVPMCAGGIDHNELVTFAKNKQTLFFLPISFNLIPLGCLAHPWSSFIGSEVCIQYNNILCAYITIAVKDVVWSLPDYFPILMMQSIMGNWHRLLDTAPPLSSCLSHIISSNNLNSMAHFMLLKGWTHMLTALMDIEVEHAKSQLKLACFSALMEPLQLQKTLAGNSSSLDNLWSQSRSKTLLILWWPEDQADGSQVPLRHGHK